MQKDMNTMEVYIDCRTNEGDTHDFYTLSMWGRPCFDYVCGVVTEVEAFTKKYLLTDSKKIKSLASKYDIDVISQMPANITPKMLISGKAIFLTKETLSRVVKLYGGVFFYQ